MGGAVGILLCNFTVPRLLGRRKYEFRVQPFPDFIGGTPGSTPAAGKKWNCKSGLTSFELEKEKAPPSTAFDVTGPVLNNKY